MEITDELITQWEPKIQRFLNTSFVLGMDREDLGQELRISIAVSYTHLTLPTNREV